MSTLLPRRPFTTAEYHRMTEAGVLTEDDHVELIDGEIVQMAAIGPRHAACVKRLAEFLIVKVRRWAMVGVQDPIQLNDYSEPEPDISLLKRRADFYAQSHPTPAEVLVAIEVAISTVESDRTAKLPIYARAGISEAWLWICSMTTLKSTRGPLAVFIRKSASSCADKRSSPRRWPNSS